MKRHSAHITAWLLLAALVSCLALPMLARRGMFIDGIFFATISRNLSVGIGSTWDLQYSETFMARFREHPPLGFVLESWLFRALGDHYWVERLYSFGTAVVSGGLIVLVWRHLARANERVRQCAWLPVMLWILTSGWRGSYGNNVLELTLGCFTLLAIYCTLRALEGCAVPWLVLAATSIVAAFYTKGPVGLFPLVTPAIAWLTLRSATAPTSSSADQQDRPYCVRRILVLQSVLPLLVVAISAVVLLDDDARRYMSDYWQQQVVASLSGQREVVGSALGRLYIVKSLVTALLLPIAVATLTILLARKLKLARLDGRQFLPAASFCLLTGLSASLPLAISPKQLSFYTGPSWPYFALALALWCAPAMLALLDWHYAGERAGRCHSMWRALAGCTMVGAISYALVVAGKPERDRDALADADAIATYVPPHTKLSLSTELGSSGAMHAYLARLHFISVAVDVCPPLRGYRLSANTGAMLADSNDLDRSTRVLLKTDRFVLTGPANRTETVAATASTAVRP